MPNFKHLEDKIAFRKLDIAPSLSIIFILISI